MTDVASLGIVVKTDGIEQATRQLDALSKQGEKTARTLSSGLVKSLGSIGKAAGPALAAGVAVAGAALVTLTTRAVNMMDKLDELSARTGISTEQLSKWGYAARLSGTSLETLGTGLRDLSRNMADALKAGSQEAKLFDSLGISIRDANGHLRSAQSVLPELADRFKVLDNQTTETALALKLFGRNGEEMLEFLNRGSQGLADMGKELESFGGVVSGDAAAAAARFKDELDRMGTVAQGLGIQIASRLAPSMAGIAEDFRKVAVDGELAANAVTLIEAAMRAGIGTINAYNQAVNVTSLTLEKLHKFAAGTTMISRNLLSFGLADGGVLDGFKLQGQAISEAVKEREEIIRQAAAGAAKPAVIFAGEGAEPAGLFGMSEAELRMRREAAGLQQRLQGALGGSSKAAKGGRTPRADNSMREALREAQQMLEAQGSWSDQLADLQAQLGGPMAQVTRDYERSIANLDAAFAKGEVTLGDYAKMQEALAQARDRDAAAVSAQKSMAEQFLDDLAFENQMLAATTKEQMRLTAARYAGADATAQQVDEATRLLATNEQLAQAQESWVDINRSMADSLYDIVSGAESAGDAIEGFFDSLINQILRNITQDWADSITDIFKGAVGAKAADGSGGFNWGQLIGSLLGGFSQGGYTGDGPRNEIAGVVHRGEYVLNASTVRALRSGGAAAISGGRSSGQLPTYQAPVLNFAVAGSIDRRSASAIASETGRVIQREMARR